MSRLIYSALEARFQGASLLIAVQPGAALDDSIR
jgi:hypothetical protein